MARLYRSFSGFLREKYGCRVYRLSLNAGFTCPNLDGTKDTEGCIFCDNRAFSKYADEGRTSDIRTQIRESMEFVSRRYKAEKFIAYFQSYTNTYADTDELREIYSIIREFPDIAGLAVSTRPDCVDSEKVGLLKEFTDEYMVWLELGLQSIHDRSLELLNRHHTSADFRNAVELTHGTEIYTGAHVILGIPGETAADMNMTAETVAELGLAGVKLHCFHIVKNTRAEEIMRKGGIRLLSKDGYIRHAADFLERLRPDCIILRLVSEADRDLLTGPDWMNHKHRVISDIKAELQRRGTVQGSFRGGSG